MTNQEKAQRLRLAEKLVTEVRDLLNQAKHKCECCGLTVYDNETEWIQRQMLNAAIDRLKKVAERMEEEQNE